MLELEEIISKKEKELGEAQKMNEHTKMENKDLRLQIANWSDQYTYIQDSTSQIIEKTRKSNLEFKKSEKKILNNYENLEKENQNLRFELEKVRNELMNVHETLGNLRGEYRILLRFKEDLETRLTITKDQTAEFRTDRFKSMGDSLLEKSLKIDIDVDSSYSLKTKRKDSSESYRLSIPEDKIKTSILKNMKKRRNNSLSKVDLENNYCYKSKCVIF